MRFIGLDLAWGPRARTGLCLVEGGGVRESASLRTDEEITSWLHARLNEECLVAVDAPLVVPNETGRRPCETLITRWFGGRHAGAHSSNRTLPAFVDGGRAMRLAKSLDLSVDPLFEPRAPVRRMIEVYPHPALVVLFALARSIKYKAKRGRDLEARRYAFDQLFDLLESLREADPPLEVAGGNDRWSALRAVVAETGRQVDLDRAEDEIDAYVCAYTALHYWTQGPERNVVAGNLLDGYIVTPSTSCDGTPDAALVKHLTPSVAAAPAEGDAPTYPKGIAASAGGTGVPATIYAGAVSHVRAWSRGRWHKGVGQPHSSQALCVSVWGTIAEHPRRAALLSRIFRAAGLASAPDTSVEVTCEVVDRPRLLNETGAGTRPTSVDALVEWSGGTVAVESKLTEPHFDSCGQVTGRPAAGQGSSPGPACSGRYESGSDLKTRSQAPCRLQVWDGDRAPRLYWQVGWDLFEPEVLRPPRRPCPFAGPSYQLMRNLVFAKAAARPRSRRIDGASLPVIEFREFGLLVAHADSHRHAAGRRRQFEDFRALLRPEVRPQVALIAYEDIADILLREGLADLASDIRRRITAAG